MPDRTPEDRPSASPLEPSEDGPSAVARTDVDVFLSYKSQELEPVRELAEHLAKAGFKPFLDRWNLGPGTSWREEIEEALSSCKAVVVFVGGDGLGDVQKREVGVALHRQDKEDGFLVVPVLLPGGEPPGGFLEGLTWLDLRHQSMKDGAAALVEALRGERGSEDAKRRMREARKRYLLNLLLLSMVLAAVALGYFRHLHTRLAHVAVGGPLLLITLLWSILGYLRLRPETALRNFAQRLLGGTRATWTLGSCLFAVVVAMVGTSSLHFVAPAPEAGAGPLSVTLSTEDGTRLWASPPLTSDRPVASKWFFFRFGLPIVVRVESQAERTPITLRLGPASRTRVRVPDQFPLRDVTVLRLLPGIRLIQILGWPGETVNRRCDLTMRMRDGEQKLEIPDLRKQAVYVSGQSDDTAIGLRREGEDARLALFGEWARTRLSLPEDRVAAFAKVWMDSRTLGGWSLSTHSRLEDLVFELTLEGASSPERLTASLFDRTNSIRTILIERAP